MLQGKQGGSVEIQEKVGEANTVYMEFRYKLKKKNEKRRASQRVPRTVWDELVSPRAKNLRQKRGTCVLLGIENGECISGIRVRS